MPIRTDAFDLVGLRLTSGEGRRLELNVAIDPFELGAEHYFVLPAVVDARLDISRTTSHGFALRLRLDATLSGPCMRCLEPATPTYSVDVREAHQPGAGEELESPFVRDGVLDVRDWARDGLALTLPATVLCRSACAGLCPVCGADLNTAGPEHHHAPEPDARWAKLSELRFD